jgi:hypothetical protein
MKNKIEKNINFNIFTDDKFDSTDKIINELKTNKLNFNLIKSIGQHIFHYEYYSNLRKCIVEILDNCDEFTEDDMLLLFLKSAQGRFVKDVNKKYSFEELTKSKKFISNLGNYKIFDIMSEDPDEYLIGFSTLEHFTTFIKIFSNNINLDISKFLEKENIILKLLPEDKKKKGREIIYELIHF